MTDDQVDREQRDGLRGARRRTVDEHMFSVDDPIGTPATFRVQVFTALGLRPVAVVTQTLSEGRSLTNSAEDFAAAVWQALLPRETTPPIWVQRQLNFADDDTGASGGRDRWELVEFDAARPYELTDPGWVELTDQQLEQLVGGPVDGSRGDGYVPRPAGPQYRTRYAVAWTVTFPGPNRSARAGACHRASPSGGGCCGRSGRRERGPHGAGRGLPVPVDAPGASEPAGLERAPAEQGACGAALASGSCLLTRAPPPNALSTAPEAR